MRVKDLEDEYCLYMVEDDNTYTAEEVREFAEYLYECLEDDKEGILEEEKDNKKLVIKARIRNFFGGCADREIEVVKEDNEILFEEWKLLAMFQNYFKRLYEVIDSESIDAGYKLICFCAKNYQDNMDYMEDIRDDLDASLKGFSSRRFAGKFTKDIFPEFFEKEFNRVVAIKPVEKRKKI